MMMKIILGTMTFGEQVDRDTAKAMLDLFTGTGNSEIDTAHQYCDGKTEEMLGLLIPPETRSRLRIASKVNPWNDQGLQPDQIEKQLTKSLARLGTSYLDLLYLHSPDLDTPIEKTLERCFDLYQQGKFKAFGLSNFASWQVAEVVEICRRNGWMEPTVYQGMYNSLTRDVERELFPCLRNYGISFYVYNPLAGGLLTGKYQAANGLPDSGRFSLHDNYQSRYWKKEYFQLLQEIVDACRDSNIQPTEAAISWLVNHSKLSSEHGDGIIIGVSKIEHLQQNMKACSQAPLDQSILDLLDRGWQLTKPDCFRYFRP
jgi:aflatoxin B1 aldehyde reductase